MKVSTVITVAFASAASAYPYNVYSVGAKGWLMQSADNSSLLFDSDINMATNWTVEIRNDVHAFQNDATGDYISCDDERACKASKEPGDFTIEGPYWDTSMAATYVIGVPNDDSVWTADNHFLLHAPADETDNQKFKIFENKD